MRGNRLLTIDLIGGGVTSGLVALGIWCAFFHLHSTGERLSIARARLTEMNRCVTQGNEALRQKNRERQALERDIAERGALPERSPVESDLREITRLAQAEGMELTQVTPVAGAEYPGLLELRYAINARTDYAELLAFLRNFKNSSLWADITQLEIGDRRRNLAEDGAERPASLVLSLFATNDRESSMTR